MADAETLRLRIYEQLAREGRVDGIALLSADIGEDEPTTAALLAALERDRHIVLDADGTIELAHPFATRDFGFSVKSHRTLWWGGCAWDSFAIPHLVAGSAPVLVATNCPGCGSAHAWNVDRDTPPTGEEVAHFLVPMTHVWDDVVHACENQRIFCGEGCVDDWLVRTGRPRGSVFDLATLWRLASEWYAGRLDRGYRRREPVAAAAYFRGAGLVGPFWGN
jgi:hypothetical protein